MVADKEFKIVDVTTYRANASECNSDYTNTAFGYKIDTLNSYSSKYIAISRDLEVLFPKGTQVCITCENCYLNGNYIIADRMSSKFKSKVDILIDNNMSIGKWKNCTITNKNYVRFRIK